MNTVYLNGEFIKEDEAKISVFDRGFIFGDGIYEVLPVIESKLVDVDGFWERLVRSLGEISLKSPLSKEEYLHVFNSLIQKNNLKEGGIYTQITRGVGKRDFYFLKDLKPTCMAFSYNVNILNNPLFQSGIKVVSVEDIRWKRRDIKSISLLGQCKAKTQAQDEGAYEGFMVEDGVVTEAVSSSAYIIKDNTIITAPLTNKILPGVRRKNIINIANKLGIKMEFRHFTVDEVKNADECFISAATLLILPVINIDNTPINNEKIGKITMLLKDEYVKEIYKQIS